MKEMRQLLDDMRSNVIAYNSPLRDVVHRMYYDQLYRNCHPIDRADFARRLNVIQRNY